MPGFGPAAKLVAWHVPKGVPFVVSAKGPNNGRALRDAPCKLTPRPASSNAANASLRRADQFAEPGLSLAEGLKQGPPADESVPPLDQTAGI